jgi:hypothetical protein
VDAAGDAAFEQAGGFQDAQVFGDGGEGHVEGSGQGSNRGVAMCEAGEDGAAGGVGEGGEGGVEGGAGSGGVIVNHSV